MKKRANAPAPATKEQIKFANECFIVKNGTLYWRNERPEKHFENGGKTTWLKNSAGKTAGRIDGRRIRVAIRMYGEPLNRSADWFIEAITGEKPKKPQRLNFSGVMAIMNNNLNCELLGV